MILPSLRQLEFLVALADERHFGRAAEKCHASQSTLSAGLKELETTLKVSVAERTRRSVTLTPVGKELADRARLLLADAKAMVDFAAANMELLSGDLRLGAIPTLAPYLLPQIVPDIRRSYPALKLFLREAKTDELLQSLHAGEIDALLLALPYEIGDLTVYPLFDDTYQLAIQPTHPLAECVFLTGKDLSGIHMMLLENGHCLQRHALSAFAPLGPHQDRTFEATSLPTLIAMVAEGLGATLLPQLAIDAGVADGQEVALVPLKGAHPRQIVLAWRKTSPRSAELRLFGEAIIEIWRAGKAEKKLALPERNLA
jgi:LysR family transcriptional regulator, hydrogen peroxide-inducible genes activator